MANPFSPEPPADPDAGPDALLEFEPERKSSKPEWIRSVLGGPPPPPAPLVRAAEPVIRPVEPVISDEPRPWRSDESPDDPPVRRSFKMNPMVGFALGVFGIVTAGGAYYQMATLLSERPSAPVTVSPPAAVPAAPANPPPAPVTGRLEVSSDPSGASVSVDGQARGQTPLTLTGVEAGRHDVVISQGTSSVMRSVNVTGGATASVVASLAPPPPPAPVVGWASFDSSVDLQVMENGRMIGTTRASRLALSPGVHELDLVSDALNVRQASTVSIVPGRNTRTIVTLPMGSLSVNALPWAEVWVNGEPVGMTPLANLSVTVGSHEIVWRHPTLGERRQVVLIKAQTPVRVGVDFNK